MAYSKVKLSDESMIHTRLARIIKKKLPIEINVYLVQVSLNFMHLFTY